ncbi:hypothetical protein DIPPA_09150 [Diplonema papillatum]|nr:hypothetical protein DIPPA_09150 [Diplonema papillatum]
MLKSQKGARKPVKRKRGTAGKIQQFDGFGFRVFGAAEVSGVKRNVAEIFYERPSPGLVLLRFERLLAQKAGAPVCLRSLSLYKPSSGTWEPVSSNEPLYDGCQVYLHQQGIVDVTDTIPPPEPWMP